MGVAYPARRIVVPLAERHACGMNEATLGVVPGRTLCACGRRRNSSTREALRCLKRHLARIVWRELRKAEARRDLLPVCGDPPARAALPLAS